MTQKEKHNIRHKTLYAVRTGKIRKDKCRDCGNEKVEAHHPDYNCFLKVIWLCKEHHLKIHRHYSYKFSKQELKKFMKENHQQLFIKSNEAAKILGVSSRTILNMIKAGKLRAKDINASKGIRHQWLILKEDVMAIDNEETS